eukprot:323822-Pleurochrysis_carterae.AAC.2
MNITREAGTGGAEGKRRVGKEHGWLTLQDHFTMSIAEALCVTASRRASREHVWRPSRRRRVVTAAGTPLSPQYERTSQRQSCRVLQDARERA